MSNIPPDVSLFPRRSHEAAMFPDAGWLLESFAPTALAGPGPRVIGTDVARYQTCNYATLAQWCGFLVAKATQGNYLRDIRYLTHTVGAENAGMIPMAYLWNDPLYPDIDQADYFLETIEGTPARAIWLDVEQEWADWNEWRMAVQGQGRITKFVSPARISESAYNIAMHLRKNCDLPVAIYSRVSFIMDYAKPMLNWISQFPLVLAQYPYSSGKIHATWEDFLANYLPKIADPQLPSGCAKWAFWQFTGDKFYLPGIDTPADIDFWNGDAASLEAWAAEGTLPPPPQPPPTMEGLCLRVVQDRLNVRSGPGTNYGVIGTLAVGQEISPLNIGGSGAWVQIDYNGQRAWANVQLGSDRNMEPV